MITLSSGNAQREGEGYLIIEEGHSQEKGRRVNEFMIKTRRPKKREHSVGIQKPCKKGVPVKSDLERRIIKRRRGGGGTFTISWRR